MNAIEISGLGKDFKQRTAVRSLDLTVGQGEFFSLLGVNGAGKTTTIRMLSCLVRPTRGDALLLGKSILKEPQAVKRIISVSPQETAVAQNLTVFENLRLIAGIYGGTPAQAKEDANRIIRELELSAIAKQRAKTLSGGWQRRLSIAMALISKPQILFLDEPTLGLDVLARRELWSVIQKLKGSVTIILTTHYLEEAEALSDRIAIMADGALRAVGSVAALNAQSGREKFEDTFVDFAARKEEAV